MKTISIRQLHDTTGKWVRAARHEPIIVTDRGAKAAVLKAFDPTELPGVPFPRRDAASLPSVGVDSTDLVAEDREER